jgi:hypothetical protein
LASRPARLATFVAAGYAILMLAAYFVSAATTAPATAPAAAKENEINSHVGFRNDVMPVLMVAGCNAGSCHGSARGQNGFHLSLFGYDPDGDYFRLTREMPNRRVNVAAPEDSLLLLKATGAVSHGGGEVLAKNSPNYLTLLRWIQAGAKNDPADVPVPVALDVEPKSLELESPGGSTQLRTRAKYSDGSERDVTALTIFKSNNDSSATASREGLVMAKNRGEAFVTARFATFTVGAQTIVVPKGLAFQWPDVPENNYVDTLVNQKLRKLRIAPSELCDDATFLRRVYLDLVGTLPPRERVESFASTKDPNKRERVVDELLARKEFVDLWVMKWAELLQIRSSDDPNTFSYKATLLYYDWLRDRLSQGQPIDQIARELLGSTGGSFRNPATNYYQVETEPIKLAENTAQVFVGMRLQCAQCHNHPFDRWTMDDYYGWTSFFSQVGRKKGEDPRETIVFNRGGGEVNNPVTGKLVPPKFLGGDSPDTKGKDRRAVLAEWLTSSDNPYFARNLANLIWANFFGRGIIDPVDDVRVSNPASNPQLLDELSRRLVAYQYDFKKLVRDICLSRTYQLSVKTNETNAGDDQNFSHAVVRRVRAEVLLDCISQVTESKQKFRGLPLGARAVEIADGRTSNYFLTTFGRATRETACSCEVKMEPNLSQALHLLNGPTVERQVQEGGLVTRLVKQKLSTPQIITELYLRCVSRAPTKDELANLSRTVESTGGDRAAVLNDIFWALLNSKEFIFNH